MSATGRVLGGYGRGRGGPRWNSERPPPPVNTGRLPDHQYRRGTRAGRTGAGEGRGVPSPPAAGPSGPRIRWAGAEGADGSLFGLLRKHSAEYHRSREGTAEAKGIPACAPGRQAGPHPSSSSARKSCFLTGPGRRPPRTCGQRANVGPRAQTRGHGLPPGAGRGPHARAGRGLPSACNFPSQEPDPERIIPPSLGPFSQKASDNSFMKPSPFRKAARRQDV